MVEGKVSLSLAPAEVVQLTSEYICPLSNGSMKMTFR